MTISLATNRYENRVVIFIDLIGFKDFVENNTATIIRDFFEKIEKERSEGEISIHGKSFSYRPTLTFFSDTIVVSLPKEIFESPPGFGAPYASMLFSIQGIASRIQLHALSNGLLTRGAVSYGKIYHNKYTWFGPALNEAYEYESNFSDVPRVIVTPSLLSFLKDSLDEAYKQKNPIIHLSEDGFYFFDYLGWIHTAYNTNDFFFDDNYDKAHAKLRKLLEEKLKSTSSNTRAYRKWVWLARHLNGKTIRLLEQDPSRCLECIKI